MSRRFLGVLVFLVVWWYARPNFRYRIPLLIFAMFFGGSTFTVLGCCPFIRAMATRIRFDRQTKIITFSGFRFTPPATIELDRVVAIQVCCVGKRFVGEGALPRTLYQLNLVLDGDPIDRFHVFECGGRRALTRLGGDIAEFLQVPLIEHVDPPGQ